MDWVFLAILESPLQGFLDTMGFSGDSRIAPTGVFGYNGLGFSGDSRIAPTGVFG